ncbi:MAG TPA: Asp23/Gls24 family envelope stress response protein, partial [Candidatus Avacidaminococcus intestinavium]|nr:Asp23/Gls24 family envelope stress response protein [Candidatus Avacidaminococcus intestinavium]
KKNFSKGVRVAVTGKTVAIEIYVIIEYGICIPDVAIAIQEKVKEAVENMTAFEVTAVDIHVQGISKRKLTNIEEDEE